MINELIRETGKKIRQKKGYVSANSIKRNLFKLLVLKYYCDKGILSYEELIKKEKIENIESPVNKENKFNIIENTQLLGLIQYYDLKKLIKEYSEKNKINLINEKNILCFSTELNIENYDITGNTTYIIDQLQITNDEIEVFKILDKMLEIENKYEKLENINIENYKQVIVYDNEPVYRFMRNSDTDIYDIIQKLIEKNNKLNITLQTSFKKISNMKEARRLIKYLSYILLYDDEKTFLCFKIKENDTISIIDYNKTKIKSIEKLKNIIKQNRKQKDILIKVTTKEIMDNYYRIGFKLYQDGHDNNKIDINKIVEENANLIEKLSYLDKRIQIEMNKLINK